MTGSIPASRPANPRLPGCFFLNTFSERCVLFNYLRSKWRSTLIDSGCLTLALLPQELCLSASTAVSMEQIRSLSSRIAAKHILFVMDYCYSGLGLNRSAGVWPGISEYLRKVSSMRVVQIITAGGQGEQVQERGGPGLFTTYFLKPLRGRPISTRTTWSPAPNWAPICDLWSQMLPDGLKLRRSDGWRAKASFFFLLKEPGESGWPGAF